MSGLIVVKKAVDESNNRNVSKIKQSLFYMAFESDDWIGR